MEKKYPNRLVFVEGYSFRTRSNLERNIWGEML